MTISPTGKPPAAPIIPVAPPPAKPAVADRDGDGDADTSASVEKGVGGNLDKKV